MIEFLDAQSFGSRLQADLAACSHCHIAVSYVRSSGIEPLLRLAKPQLEHSQIVTCTDFGITEPDALITLLRHGYRIRAFQRPGLHAKVWLIFFDNQPPVLYLGSSNLSQSATSTNIEANVRLVDANTIGTAIRWFSSLIESRLTFDVDGEWIEAYRAVRREAEPLESVVPLRNDEQYAFVNPAGEWHERTGGKTFLSQGIIEGVTQASPSRSKLLERISVDHRARLVLLRLSKEDNPSVAADINATFNPTGDSTVQLGGGRKQVRQWISEIWQFDTTTSFDRRDRNWEDWFSSTGRALESFKYEVLVDLKDIVPTIWVRPKS